MEAKDLDKIRKKGEPQEESRLHKWAKWFLIGAIILVSLELVTKPIRCHWASNYREQGDQYLIQKKYLSAELEYQKSLFLYKGKAARERLVLTNQAQTDVLALKPFLKERKVTKSLEDFDKATAKYSHYDALRVSKELYEKGELQLALVALESDTDRTSAEYQSFDKIISKAIVARTELSSQAKEKYLE